ncbi:transporter [Paucibacter sp. B2R-40]|uniref:transporter n=1 Tax=Paucibacter sp. B2R-40 TaxID=2893554 RepID=UPI0021E4C3EA|nr:transporter [Paucibacter sp. B2R-40]MCV2353253.1 transporter [Paucibacter sp. B2R-40]
MKSLLSSPTRIVSIAVLLLSAAHAPAQAQSTDSKDAAREALAKQDSDTDQTAILKAALSAQDKQYSLIRKGKMALTYDFGYAYIGAQQINARFADSTLTLFSIQNTRSHTVTNSFSADYGLRDNMTANVVVPLVSKFSESETYSGMSNGFGDISLGMRWQPLALSRDMPSFTTSTSLRLPTGRSPFKVTAGQGLSTGSGFTALTLGANTSKVMDPVALFGSVSLTLGAPVRHLSQQLNSATLTGVDPGASFGFGMGFAYALSYKVSTTVSFQETISAKTRLILADGKTSDTSTQTSGLLSFGLGVRASPQTTVNVSVGVGLGPDAPAFTLGCNIPLNF